MKKNYLTTRFSRISWGAIIAGGLTAVSVSFLLNLLGVGVGFSSINPETELNPLEGLGTGTLVWFVISNLVALFAGAWVAGRFAGFPNKKDAGLHGFMAWVVYTAISFFFLTSTVAGAISGVGGFVSSIFGGGSNKEVTVNIEDAKKQAESNSSMSIENIKSKLFSVINKAEDLNVLPDNTSKEVKAKLEEAQVDGEKMIKDLKLDEQIKKFVSSLDYNIDDQGNLSITAEGDYFDEVSIKDYLTKNTKLTEEQINDLVNNWKGEVDNALEKAKEYYNKTIQKVREYSQNVAEAMAKVAIYGFFALLIGAIVSFFGGTLGAPKHSVKAFEEEDNI